MKLPTGEIQFKNLKLLICKDKKGPNLVDVGVGATGGVVSSTSIWAARTPGSGRRLGRDSGEGGESAAWGLGARGRAGSPVERKGKRSD